VANKSDVFQRLIGLETEYALLVPSRPEGPRPSRYSLYRELVAVLRRKIPCARARNMKEGVFHAAGGAVWFETERPALGGGLIEGSTPECTSPRQLVIWQRAQDALLTEATHEAFGGAVRLLKNDRDAAGNIYGAQESYEVTLAQGWRLALWRTMLVLLLPIAALTWLALVLIDKLVEIYALAAALVYLAAERFLPRPEWLARLLFGCSVKDLATDTPTGPAWLEAILSLVARVVTAPLAVLLFAGLWLTAFVPIRRQLTPFLISRAILGGSGMLDAQGHFLLADKALAMNCLTGFGGLLGDRPIYCLGHFFKTVYADAWLAPQEYWRLAAPRQRLQIGLGDSNLAEVAEYLRVGTTLLVLDVIEAGEMPPVPPVQRPIAALRAVCGDPTLAARVALAEGRSASALEIQRFYLEACRRFLERRPAAPAEARDLLSCWEAVLDALADHPERLVGTLDWVTKRYLLDTSGCGATWEARKKIDLRYHELSPQGYFSRLRNAGVAPELVSGEELEYARRNPPQGTPAAARGHYIREWAAEEDLIAVNWQAVYLGPRRDCRVVRLDRRPRRPAERERRRKQRRGSE
jgi:proteasome accessory factor A